MCVGMAGRRLGFRGDERRYQLMRVRWPTLHCWCEHGKRLTIIQVIKVKVSTTQNVYGMTIEEEAKLHTFIILILLYGIFLEYSMKSRLEG